MLDHETQIHVPDNDMYLNDIIILNAIMRHIHVFDNDMSLNDIILYVTECYHETQIHVQADTDMYLNDNM